MQGIEKKNSIIISKCTNQRPYNPNHTHTHKLKKSNYNFTILPISAMPTLYE